jgi:hypothetical protein
MYSRKPLRYCRGIVKTLKFDELRHIFRTKHYNCVDISLLMEGNSYKIDGGGFSSGWCDREEIAAFRFVCNYFGCDI